MDSETNSTTDSSSLDPQPRRLKDLACSVKFPRANNLLHKFVLDHSEPNKLGDEDAIRVVLLAMRDVSNDVVNALNDFGFSALHLAVEKGNLFLVEKLLSCLANIDVDVRSYRKQTPLHVAARVGHIQIIPELLDKRASIDLLDESRATALCYAAWQAHLDVMELLVSEGSSVNPAGVYLTPLSCAVMSRNLAAVEFLVSKDADINGAGNTGETPLHIAAHLGYFAMVHFLVGKRANIHAADMFGAKPIHSASESPEIAAFLLDLGADINSADGCRRTPLHHAAERGSSEWAALLVDRGADLRVADEDGWTPLHFAADGGRVDVIKLLLERGADANAKNEEGNTPLDLLQHWGHQSWIDGLQFSALSLVLSAPRCCVM